MVISGVPFYSNTPDSTHCFQAVLRMVIGYFEPNRALTWAQLDKITGKREGLWTSTGEGLSWLQDHSYTVNVVEAFDYRRFIDEGVEYMRDAFGDEVAKAQEEHSDIPYEQRIAKRFLQKVEVTKRAPDFNEIETFITEGHLVICAVNSRKMNDMPGYAGHSVLVVGFDNDSVIINDPGGKIVKGQAYRHVPRQKFLDAWAFPNNEATNLVAITK